MLVRGFVAPEALALAVHLAEEFSNCPDTESRPLSLSRLRSFCFLSFGRHDRQSLAQSVQQASVEDSQN